MALDSQEVRNGFNFQPKLESQAFSGEGTTGVPRRKKTPTRLEPPSGPGHGPTVGSYGLAVSHKRSTPVDRGAPEAVTPPKPHPPPMES